MPWLDIMVHATDCKKEAQEKGSAQPTAWETILKRELHPIPRPATLQQPGNGMNLSTLATLWVLCNGEQRHCPSWLEEFNTSQTHKHTNTHTTHTHKRFPKIFHTHTYTHMHTEDNLAFVYKPLKNFTPGLRWGMEHMYTGTFLTWSVNA